MSNNRHPPVHRWIEVEDIPFDGGPDLPKRRRDGRPWPEDIRDKWDAWRSMPHARLWQARDWQFAMDALELATRLFYEDGPVGLAAELRAREKVMATTWDARQGLRIRYTDPGASSTLASVTSLEDYRDL